MSGVARKHRKFEQLVQRCDGFDAIPMAVVHPCDDVSLEGAVAAAARGLIAPVLVGPAARISATAKAAGLDIGGFPLVDTPHSHASAERAVALVREGRAEALMKGSLHTDELMAAVVDGGTGLRTARRLSHCFLLDVPSHDEPLIITDAAVNIAPSLRDKRDIVQNAIDLAGVLEFDGVRVAILSAMETVNPEVPSTVEAAALCKMADRGQITGGVLDGPLALDNAISLAAARSCQRARGAGSRGRQHAGQEPVLPGRCGCRRDRARRTRAGGPDQSGRPLDLPARFLRHRRPAGPGEARGAGQDGAMTMHGIVVGAWPTSAAVATGRSRCR